MAKRIQRKRTKGWRKPEGAVYVGRGTKWGNPFVVERGENGSLIWYHVARDGERVSIMCWNTPQAAQREAADMYRNWLENGLACTDPEEDAPADWGWFVQLDLDELRGKDLMCWCAEGEPCHADVLIELATP